MTMESSLRNDGTLGVSVSGIRPQQMFLLCDANDWEYLCKGSFHLVHAVVGMRYVGSETDIIFIGLAKAYAL